MSRRRLARIDLKGMEQRVARLEQLQDGLSREVALWRGKQSPLLDGERRAYLNGAQDLIKGLDDARVVMSKALERVSSETGPYGRLGA